MKKVRKGDWSRIEIVDTHFKDQAVATFPVKVCSVPERNPDWYGVNINDSSMLSRIASFTCEQMNRESGY